MPNTAAIANRIRAIAESMSGERNHSEPLGAHGGLEEDREYLRARWHEKLLEVYKPTSPLMRTAC